MSQSFHLYQLQKVDSQIDQIDLRLSEIEQILMKDQRIQQANLQLQSTQEALKQARQALTMAESAVKARQIKIEQSQAALYGGTVHNPKELQNLQNEITALKRNLETLENEQLEAMIAFEEAEKAVQNAQKTLHEAQALVNSQNAALNGEKEQLLKKRQRFETERLAIQSQIQDTNLEIYQRLRKQKKGIAIAQVEDEACTICGSVLTPGEWQAARSPQKITYCSSCGRILYTG